MTDTATASPAGAAPETGPAGTAREADAPEPRNPLRTPANIVATIVLAALLAASLAVGLDATPWWPAAVRGVVIVGWWAAGIAIWRQDRMLTPVVLAGTAAGAAASLGAALIARTPALVSHETARTIEVVGSTLAVSLLLHAIVALPDGRLSSRTLRIISGTLYAICLGFGALLLALPDHPAHVLALVGALMLVAFIAASATYTLRRYHRLAATDRRTGQWITAGAALSGMAGVLITIGAILFRAPSDGSLAALVASLPMPAAVATDATPLSRRSDRALVSMLTLLGGVIVAGVIAVAVVAGIGHRPTGPEREPTALALLAGVLVLASWGPVRRSLHARASHFTYGDRPAPDAVLHTLSENLSRSIPLGDLLDEVATMLSRTLGPVGSEIWTGHDDLFERSAGDGVGEALTMRVPAAARDALCDAPVVRDADVAERLPGLGVHQGGRHVRLAPVTHHGGLLGLVLVARPDPGDGFDDADEEVLVDLARQLGLALHNVQLDSSLEHTMAELRRHADELQASRARLVVAGNAERRRLERDLHDGAQQQLVGLAVTINVARDMVQRDPDEAVALLEQVSGEVRAAIDELRNLARGIYPPLLADRGLREAVTAAARRSPSQVDVSAGGIGRYPPDAEAAVYFCCLEALQNAAKHAADAPVAVSVVDDGEVLSFEVSDRGPGFDPALAVRGDGFTNMADRLGAFGGEIEVRTGPSGTTVVGRIPLVNLAPRPAV